MVIFNASLLLYKSALLLYTEYTLLYASVAWSTIWQGGWRETPPTGPPRQGIKGHRKEERRSQKESSKKREIEPFRRETDLPLTKNKTNLPKWPSRGKAPLTFNPIAFVVETQRLGHRYCWVDWLINVLKVSVVGCLADYRSISDQLDLVFYTPRHPPTLQEGLNPLHKVYSIKRTYLAIRKI